MNSAILGQDGVPGTPEFDLFVKEVRKEMTVKCGQKCTAVRRIFVPEGLIDQVQEALTAQLAKTTVEIRGRRSHGACVNAQCLDVLKQVEAIETEAECVFGQAKSISPLGDDVTNGAFLPPC